MNPEGKDDADVLFATKDHILHDTKKTYKENLMDLMAATILVPKKIFVEDMHKNDIKYISSFEKVKEVEPWKIELLANKYNVDPTMIERRIYEVSCCAD